MANKRAENEEAFSAWAAQKEKAREVKARKAARRKAKQKKTAQKKRVPPRSGSWYQEGQILFRREGCVAGNRGFRLGRHG